MWSPPSLSFRISDSRIPKKAQKRHVTKKTAYTEVEKDLRLMESLLAQDKVYYSEDEKMRVRGRIRQARVRLQEIRKWTTSSTKAVAMKTEVAERRKEVVSLSAGARARAAEAARTAMHPQSQNIAQLARQSHHQHQPQQGHQPTGQLVPFQPVQLPTQPVVVWRSQHLSDGSGTNELIFGSPQQGVVVNFVIPSETEQGHVSIKFDSTITGTHRIVHAEGDIGSDRDTIRNVQMRSEVVQAPLSVAEVVNMSTDPDLTSQDDDTDDDSDVNSVVTLLTNGTLSRASLLEMVERNPEILQAALDVSAEGFNAVAELEESSTEDQADDSAVSV